MATFVNQAKEINGLTFYLVLDVKWKWLCAAARIAMRSDVITTAPTNNLPRLTCNTFMECTSSAFPN